MGTKYGTCKIELIVLKHKKLKKDFLDALKFDQLRSHSKLYR